MKSISILTILLVSSFTQAQSNPLNEPGTSSSGGGDPYAIEFLQIAKKLRPEFAKNPQVDIAHYDDLVEAMVESLDSEDRALVVFVPDDAHNPITEMDGDPKPSLFDKTDGSVKLYKSDWRVWTPEQKKNNVRLEMGGLVSVDRYRNVLNLASVENGKQSAGVNDIRYGKYNGRGRFYLRNVRVIDWGGQPMMTGKIRYSHIGDIAFKVLLDKTSGNSKGSSYRGTGGLALHYANGAVCSFRIELVVNSVASEKSGMELYIRHTAPTEIPYYYNGCSVGGYQDTISDKPYTWVKK